MSADNEMWQVLLSGDITDVDLGTLKQWISEGKVQKTDKVRKGGGSWVDVARTPALRAALSAVAQQQQSSPAPVIQVQDNSANVAQTAPSSYDGSSYGSQQSANTASNQPYLPPEQSEGSYLDPNKDYSAPAPEPLPQPAGTVFQGEAPPKGFLQTEALPEAFRKENIKKPKRISVEDYAKRMTNQQSLGGLLTAGGVGTVFSVAVWALYASSSQSKSYWICLGIGYLMAELARRFGKCYQQAFGAIAAVFTLIASFSGQLIGLAVVLALESGVSKGEVFSHLELGKAYTEMMSKFGALNLILYLGAAYITYYFCFRTDTEMD